MMSLCPAAFRKEAGEGTKVATIRKSVAKLE
jgi:hypothetical protein